MLEKTKTKIKTSLKFGKNQAMNSMCVQNYCVIGKLLNIAFHLSQKNKKNLANINFYATLG